MNAKRNVSPGGILKLSLTEQKDGLHFSIYNEGREISKEDLKKIWTKFYRNPNASYGGSGLGLAIVAQILSMQGFSYGVENQPGGVKFYFTIPAVK